jgi:hypothetical protein
VAFASPGGIGIIGYVNADNLYSLATSLTPTVHNPTLLFDIESHQYYRLPWTLPTNCGRHESVLQMDDGTLVVFGRSTNPLATNTTLTAYAMKQAANNPFQQWHSLQLQSGVRTTRPFVVHI